MSVMAAGLIVDDYMGRENPDAHIFRFGRSERSQPAFHLSSVGSVSLFQRRFRRAGDYFSVRFESRTVARAVPCGLGLVPVDDATEMGADGREVVIFPC